MNHLKILEIGTGYTSIPSKVGAATEIVVEEIVKSALGKGMDITIFDIADTERTVNMLPIQEVYLPSVVAGKVGVKLGVFHKMKRVWYSVALALRLNRYLQSGQHYIVHFHNQYNFYFFWMLSTAGKRKNLKLYYTNHTYSWSLPWNEIESLVRKKYFMERYSMKRADRVFVLNEQTAKNLTDHVNVDKARVKLMPNGVNTEIYTKLPAGDAGVGALRIQLHLENKKVLFHAGTVCDRKNQLEIIRYLTPFFKSHPDFVLVFAGGISERDYFDAINRYCTEAEIEKNVHYAGELHPGKELNQYYNLAEAFIFFSKSEGFSLALLEALSSGLPVILSRNLEIGFIKGENNGVLTFAGPEEMRSVLQEEILCPDRQQQHARQGRAFVQENYSWDRIVDQYFPDHTYADHPTQ